MRLTNLVVPILVTEDVGDVGDVGVVGGVGCGPTHLLIQGGQ